MRLNFHLSAKHAPDGSCRLSFAAQRAEALVSRLRAAAAAHSGSFALPQLSSISLLTQTVEGSVYLLVVDAEGTDSLYWLRAAEVAAEDLQVMAGLPFRLVLAGVSYA